MSILDVTAADYHADAVADQPTLSASIAALLVEKSPAHAREQHPRLNPFFKREEPKDHFDLGHIVHSIILEGKEPLDVVHVVEGYDNWKSPKAREERDYMRGQGMIPLLGKDLDAVLAMAEAARDQIAAYNADPPLLTDGKPEQTIAWDEDGVSCRCRPDWLRNDYTVCEDVKTTARGAKPDYIARKTVFDYSYDLKAAMYLRGIKAVSGVDAAWRWIFLETTPPYLVTVVQPSEDTLAIGNAKVDAALEMWRDCLEAGVWPGYTTDIYTAEPPAWQYAWLDNSDQYEEAAWAGM